MSEQAETTQNTQELWEKIKDEPYCDPKKRMDFVLFFDVRDGNPNGDPDAGNLPRMDPQTRHGIVTDVCIKRKIRDYIAAVLGRDIYIQSQASLNSLYFKAAREVAEDTSDENKKGREAVSALLVELDEKENEDFKKLIALPENKERAGESNQEEEKSEGESKPSFSEYLASIEIDGLEFHEDGGVLSYLGEANNTTKFKDLFKESVDDYETYKKEFDELAGLMGKAKGKGGGQERDARDAVTRRMWESYYDIRLFGGVLTAGTNAGQIRGPMQLTFARSVDPILQQDAAITRCAITTSADWKKKQTEFGRKPWLNWAVYRQHGFFNPLLGQKTGVSKEDLARFWEALACMFRNCDAASKGEMHMHDIVVFVHEHPRGSAPSHKLFDRVEVKRTVSGNESKPNVTIRRNGFEQGYMISVDNSTEQAGIKVCRPLQDIWS